MDTIYALDTNIVIRYLRNDARVTRNFINAVADENNMVIPQMVDYERRRGFCVAPAPKKEASYSVLTERCIVVEMASWERAAQVYFGLYRAGFTVGEMDILIAALCLDNGYTLVTNNTADFVNISGLSLVDRTQNF